MNETYSDRMIEAFIDKPSVTLWYQNVFSKYNINGVDTMKWNWSWWAFGGGFLYLLYRKEYLASLVLFLFSSILGFVFPLSLIIMVLSGGYATFFVYKGYKKKLQKIESIIEDEEKRIEVMRKVGGYNQWVVWVYTVVMILMFVSIIFLIDPLLR